MRVRDIWEIYDHCLQFVPVADALAIERCCGECRDGHLAWYIWSVAAERALASAFGMAGGPVPPQGLVLGRGEAQYRICSIGVQEGEQATPGLG